MPGWDINPYNNGGCLIFYDAASPSGILATGIPGTTAIASVLALSSFVGPGSMGFYNQFQTLGTNFQTADDRYIGFRFSNDAATPVTYYGHLLIRSGGTTGFPASIVSYGYENTGLAVTIGAVPKIGTFAMLGLGLAGIAGLSNLRRRRVA